METSSSAVASPKAPGPGGSPWHQNAFNRERLMETLRGAARLGGLLAAVAVVMAVFAAASGGKFLYVDNLLGMLRYMSTLAIVGLGLTVVLIVGEIDLSFANLYGLAVTVLAVSWMVWGWPLWLSFVLTFAVAIAVGCFNAFFTAVVKIPSFIATLGSSALIFGFTLLIGDAKRFSPQYPPDGTHLPAGEVSFFSGLANQKLPGDLPMQVLWMIGVAIIFWVIISRSMFGFRVKAVGGNQAAARLAKLPVVKYKFAAFIIVALAAALAGILDVSFIGSVQPDSGQELLFPTFAAVIIGGASLQGGRGTVLGTLSGALLLAVIANGLALLAAGAFVQQMFIGSVTIGAVVLDLFTRKWRRDS